MAELQRKVPGIAAPSSEQTIHTAFTHTQAADAVTRGTHSTTPGDQHEADDATGLKCYLVHPSDGNTASSDVSAVTSVRSHRICPIDDLYPALLNSGDERRRDVEHVSQPVRV